MPLSVGDKIGHYEVFLWATNSGSSVSLTVIFRQAQFLEANFRMPDHSSTDQQCPAQATWATAIRKRVPGKLLMRLKICDRISRRLRSDPIPNASPCRLRPR